MSDSDRRDNRELFSGFGAVGQSVRLAKGLFLQNLVQLSVYLFKLHVEPKECFVKLYRSIYSPTLITKMEQGGRYEYIATLLLSIIDLKRWFASYLHRNCLDLSSSLRHRVSTLWEFTNSIVIIHILRCCPLIAYRTMESMRLWMLTISCCRGYIVILNFWIYLLMNETIPIHTKKGSDKDYVLANYQQISRTNI